MSTVSGNYYGGIVIDGLVLLLDAAKRDSYPKTGTAWNDISRNGNNGTLINGPTFNVGNGGSVVFDGVDDYTQTNLNLSYTSYPNISLSCWIKMTKTDLLTFTTYNPLGVYVPLFPNSSPIRLYTNGTKQAFVAVQGDGSTVYSTTDLSNGNWQHVLQTCQYDVGGTICNVYINGVQEITNTLLRNYAPLGGNLSIGSQTGTSLVFKGGIAQALVYNRILSTTEILQNFNATRSRFGI